MDRINPEHVLHGLRHDYRVPQPKVATHPLLRTMRKEVKVPVYYHTRKRYVRSGSSPAGLYEDGALYVHIEDGLKHNWLIHELAHCLVARKFGKLEMPNFGLEGFGLNEPDEILACQTEFYLGFSSGFYSWENLGDYAEQYMFLEEFDSETSQQDVDDDGVERFGLDAIRRQDAFEFVLEFRDGALSIPGVKEICKNLHIPMDRGYLLEKVARNWRA